MLVLVFKHQHKKKHRIHSTVNVGRACLCIVLSVLEVLEVLEGTQRVHNEYHQHGQERLHVHGSPFAPRYCTLSDTW